MLPFIWNLLSPLFNFLRIYPLQSLICNYLLFQWVLGHVWGLRRSRVVIKHCSVWVSDSQSCRLLCCSSCQVTHLLNMCQVVVLTEMVFWSLWIVMMHVSANFPGIKVVAGSSFKFSFGSWLSVFKYNSRLIDDLKECEDS